MAAVVLGLLPSTAGAATYSVQACKLQGGGAAPVDGVTFSRFGSGMSSVNGCASGGHLGIDVASGSPRGSAGWWTLEAPANTKIASATLYRSVQAPGVGATWNFGYGLYRDAIVWDAAHRLEATIGTGIGNLGTPLGAANKVTFDALSAARLIAYLDCSTGYPGDCGGAAGLQIHRADLLMEDASDPQFVNKPSGGLVDAARPLRGVEGVALSATDQGGGLLQTELEIDGVVVDRHPLDTNGGKCVPPFTSLVPCKLSASDTFTFDTTRLSEGQHSLRLIVEDATDQNRVVHGPVKVVVDNVPDAAESHQGIGTKTPVPTAAPAGGGSAGAATAGIGAPNGTGASAGAQLTSFFDRSRETTTKADYGTRKVIRGRLVDPNGRPISGATLTVLSRVDGSDDFVAAGEVRTNADGRYAYRAPAGPSRTFRFAYRAFRGDASFADTSDVKLRVAARAALRVRPGRVRNGQAVTFRGRVLGGHLPSRGVHVDLQVRQGGWRTFGVARSNRRGTFTLRYRFTRTFRPTSYTFRARVRGEAGVPYESGVSKQVRVRVG
jgi:hypothetical protein